MNKGRHHPHIATSIALAVTPLGPGKGCAASGSFEMSQDSLNAKTAEHSFETDPVVRTPHQEQRLSGEDDIGGAVLESAGQVVVEIPGPPKPFGSAERSLFHDLAVKVALGEATDEEQLRLSELQKRGREKEAQSPDEVLSEYRRRQAAMEIRQFLQRHVRFFKGEA